MNMLTAIFAVVLAVVIIVIGLIMINPETASQMSIFKDTANGASQTGKSTMNEISKTNASSITGPLDETKDELLGIIRNSTS
jgi:hypothetical protein